MCFLSEFLLKFEFFRENNLMNNQAFYKLFKAFDRKI